MMRTLHHRPILALGALLLLGFMPGVSAQVETHGAHAPEATVEEVAHADDAHAGAAEHALPAAPGSELLDEPEHEAAAPRVSPAPYHLFEIPLGSLRVPVTNAMAMSWVISILVILAIRIAVGKAQIIPGRGQAVVEAVVGGIRDTLEPIVGRRMIGKTFPILIGLFIFILMQNWSGLIPGVGAFGFVEHGHLTYWMRPGNADLNMMLALAVVHMVAWLYFVLRYAGPRLLFHDIFGNKANRNEVPGAIYIFLFFVFFFVGGIELFSIALRVVSLSVRLFGNVYGGESLLTSVTDVVPWVLPAMFYALEALIGLVQAFVFMLLVAVYIGLICNHGDEDEHAHAH